MKLSSSSSSSSAAAAAALTETTDEKLKTEFKRINKCKEIIDKSWTCEVELYEQNVQQHPSLIHTSINERIFPYHKQCIHLLDMYTGLDREFEYSSILLNDDGTSIGTGSADVSNAINSAAALAVGHNRHLTEGGGARVEGYLPCGANGMKATFLPNRLHLQHHPKVENSKIDDDDNNDENSDNGHNNNDDDDENSDNEDDSNGAFSFLFENHPFHFLSEWEKSFRVDKKASIRECYVFSTYEEAQEYRQHKQQQQLQNYSDINDMDDEIEKCTIQEKHIKPLIGNMPKGQRTKVLLKLLKHSMSDLQRDHRLAKAVVLSMIEYQCFDGGDDGSGVEALRYFLVTFLSEYIYNCNGECHENYLFNRTEEQLEDDDNDDDCKDDDSNNPRPTHYCDDYKSLMTTIMLIVSDGIKLMTDDHANVLVAFVTRLYEASGWKEVDHMKSLIGYDDDDSVSHDDKPYRIINWLITGLGVKAYEDRCRLKTLMRWKYSNSSSKVTSTDNNNQKSSSQSSLDDEIDAVSKSHLLSLNTLVRIGKITLKRLPADTVTEYIGSRLVRCLVVPSIDLIPHKISSRFDVCSKGRHLFIGDKFGGYNESIINENRYSNGINPFVLKKKRLYDIKRTFLDESCNANELEDDLLFQQIFLSPPSTELQNVVKGLFLSQLVDVDYSGCGYGDFLVWCRLPIHIHEPMLYEHVTNYPNYIDNNDDDSSDDDSSDEEDSENDFNIKYHDEEGEIVKVDRLKARYDFSLLCLKQIWSKPWSPKNHSSYQIPFQEAVWSLVLCAHRYGMSSDIPKLVSAFLPRTWWPDERIKCWRYECEIDNINNLIYNHQVRKIKPLIVCDDCKTAYACSQKHLASIYHDGHRRICKLPPMRAFNHQDEMFIRTITGKNNISSGSRIESDEDEVEGNANNDDSDDDSCWESIASDEDNSDSKTELIHRYFATAKDRHDMEVDVAALGE